MEMIVNIASYQWVGFPFVIKDVVVKYGYRDLGNESLYAVGVSRLGHTMVFPTANLKEAELLAKQLYNVLDGKSPATPVEVQNEQN